MQAPYIPTTDSGLASWLANFSGLITATPTDYGLVGGDATIIQAANDTYQASYLAALNPATRTSPAIAQKDADKSSAIATVRPYAVNISLNSGVSDMNKIGVGVNLPNPARTPIPPPSTQPVLKLNSVNPNVADIGYYDVTTPLSKAKPFGAIALQLVQTIGTAPAVAPDAADYIGDITKSPNTVTFLDADKGKVATLWGRWRTKSGPKGVSQFGPWSTALSFNIV